MTSPTRAPPPKGLPAVPLGPITPEGWPVASSRRGSLRGALGIPLWRRPASKGRKPLVRAAVNTRTVVEFMGDGVQVGLAERAEVRAFGEVLPK